MLEQSKASTQVGHIKISIKIIRRINLKKIYANQKVVNIKNKHPRRVKRIIHMQLSMLPL